MAATGAEIVPLERMSELTEPQAPEITDALEGVQRYGFQHPGAFAGALGSGAVIYAGFTDDRETHLRTLQKLVPETTIQVFAAKHSQDDLLDVVRTISADRPALRNAGIVISGIGVDVRRNRVNVNFGGAPEPAWLATLAQRYGTDVLSFAKAPKTFFVA